MAGSNVISLPRIEQRIPFFEQASPKKDSSSWQAAIESNLSPYPVQIKQLVSDRATALVQLGKADYLNINSMPDLFHFKQILAQKAGTIIGKARQKSLKLYREIKESGVFYSKRKPYEDRYLYHDNAHRKYQIGMDLINKAIHAFDINGQWKNPLEVRRQITKAIVMIEEALISSRALTNTLKAENKETLDLYGIVKQKQEDGFKVEVIEKLYRQIPDILEGLKQWQDWTKERLHKFVDQCFEQHVFPQTKPIKVKSYLLYNLLPLIYWQTILSRTSCKKRNKNLRKYYQKLILRCEQKIKCHPLHEFLTLEQKQICRIWCEEIARSFQRASSQVEGRNGYLAFVHKANRGMSKQRLNVLTVVHNFDIRGLDSRTPAERLFGKIMQEQLQRGFPDLFEFALKSVTSFPEPRHKTHNPLIINNVRA